MLVSIRKQQCFFTYKTKLKLDKEFGGRVLHFLEIGGWHYIRYYIRYYIRHCICRHILYYIPLCLDCKFRDVSASNSAGNSDGMSACDLRGISAGDSNDIAARNSVCISHAFWHSKSVPFSFMTPYRNLNFWSPRTRSRFREHLQEFN